MLDNASNPPSKIKTKNWVKINDKSWGGCTTGSDIKFKNTMLTSSLSDFADVYILVKGTTTITGAGDDAAAWRADERNKGVIFKHFALYIKRYNKINHFRNR